ncbi:hypothetical protein BGY98DRAFT_1097546 [Russula aff. rugulosa BPL654]|nr:hypothetical protein BGY98DRAFT_1097546 [Russula aff. rugulosa BPL654]
MDSKPFSLLSLQNYANAELLFDPRLGSQISPLLSKEDTLSLPLTSPASSSYSASAIHTQHKYCLTNGKGKGNESPWLTLRVSSRSPKSKLLPLFIGNDSISGVVELEFANPETVREVKVTLKGEKTHQTQEPRTFLELSQVLIKQKPKKLSGKYSVPFSFALPDVVRVDESNWVMVYPLPPKFHEKGLLYIDYKIVVTVRHGFLPVDSSLETQIVHMPGTIAENPSPLRELAYLDDIPIALPEIDSDGWKVLPPVKVALVPNAIVTARLSIANPLSFALGTPIPLFLELSNGKAGNFDLDSIDIRLVRTVTTHSVPVGVRKLDIARAAFWPAPCSSSHRIKLWGEVIAGRSLTPSFVFSKCSVQYSIVLYPRHSPQQTKPEPLLKEEVILTLRSAPGVAPRSQAPPGLTPAQIERQPLVPPRDFPVDFGMIL